MCDLEKRQTKLETAMRLERTGRRVAIAMLVILVVGVVMWVWG